MASVVRLREAVALAGHFPLLTGATLEVAEGEVIHLQGPNGAGKTSLLRLCCGLVALTSGEAVVLEHDLAVDRRAVRRDVGLLGHSSFLYDELTAEENVLFALRAFGLGSREARVRARGSLERLGVVGRLASTPVARLSAGQRRRTSIAVLLGRQPRLWLLDEPHAGLDQASRDLLDGIIAESREAGATIVLASHELGRAAAVADRAVHVAGGRVTAEPAHVA
jgi:heme ABC exporter ATP-binding subunit CcmA